MSGFPETMNGIARLAGVTIGDGLPVRLMAALNVSPESFYAGSVRVDAPPLRDAAQQAAAEGADILDIGAMSTAPYLKTKIPVAEEVRRMTWALEIVQGVTELPLCADTTRGPVAAAALAAGARIINDVTGLRGDRAMADTAVQAEGVVVVASQPAGTDAVQLPIVRRLLAESLKRAADVGIPAERIVIDPGIGFFTRTRPSSVAFNCAVLAQLGTLADLGRPVLVGVSRKSFLGVLAGSADPMQRLEASLGATAIAVYNGAAMVRTHDVAATRHVVRVAEAIRARHGS